MEGSKMLGHFGFSYTGLLFLLLLFLPNLFWTKKKPQGYTSQNENKLLSALERAGEVLTTICVLIFDDFNLHGWFRLVFMACSRLSAYGTV